MKVLISAVILAAAAVGGVQAQELGYRDDPAVNTMGANSRAQVDQELATARQQHRNVQEGELDLTRDNVVPATSTTPAGTTRDGAARQPQPQSKAGGDTAYAMLVNG